MKKLFTLVLATLLSLSFIGMAFAQATPATPATPTKRAAEEKKEEGKAEKKGKKEKSKEKLGKGEMAIAEDLAKKSGKSVDEIVAMRKSGLGWGQIAHKLGVQPGSAGGREFKPAEKPGSPGPEKKK